MHEYHEQVLKNPNRTAQKDLPSPLPWQRIRPPLGMTREKAENEATGLTMSEQDKAARNIPGIPGIPGRTSSVLAVGVPSKNWHMK
ncbi:MAG: hypothetical protein LBR95_01625 [Azoarcus sp.]|jgi:hypothetical protein|nr:hypothetical protein [Azoarcus sp.]